MNTPQEGVIEMGVKTMSKLAIVTMVMVVAVAYAERSDSAMVKASDGMFAKTHKRQQSLFRKEFPPWAAKQDWFALSKTAEFGDMNREKCVDKGMTFGYSVEFEDSKGVKYILGIGLAREPEDDEKMEMKKHLAQMCAQKNVMMHGQKVSSDASGRKSRSFSGTLYAQSELSKTIMRPGTEEKWILCVCRGKKGVADVSPTSANRKENRTQAPSEENRN